MAEQTSKFCNSCGMTDTTSDPIAYDLAYGVYLHASCLDKMIAEDNQDDDYDGEDEDDTRD